MMKRLQLVNPKTQNHQRLLGLDLNLLKVRILPEEEIAARNRMMTWISLCIVCVILWGLVYRINSGIGALLQKKAALLKEKASIEAQIASLGKVAAKPPDVLKTQRAISQRVDWASRLEVVRASMPKDVSLDQIVVGKDGTMELQGSLPDVRIYADVIETLRKIDFVSGVRSAGYATRSEGGNGFSILLSTALPASSSSGASVGGGNASGGTPK